MTSGPHATEVLRTYFVYWCIHLPLAAAPTIMSIVWIASNAKQKSESDGPIVAMFASLVWLVVYALIFASADGRRLKSMGTGA